MWGRSEVVIFDGIKFLLITESTNFYSYIHRIFLLCVQAVTMIIVFFIGKWTLQAIFVFSQLLCTLYVWTIFCCSKLFHLSFGYEVYILVSIMKEKLESSSFQQKHQRFYGTNRWSYRCVVNPLHSNISMHILHTVLYTFPKVLIRRICLNNSHKLL